jgi:peptidoglycan/LPS O-acetylase OafA/YrhL
VFFVISGWCIAERLAKARRTGESAVHFAVERILRIYPTYWAALAVIVVLRLAAAPFNSLALAQVIPHGWRGWVGAAFLIEPYIRDHEPNLCLVSWTLRCELGFYAIGTLALAAGAIGLKRASLLFWGGALLCFLHWAPFRIPDPVWILGFWPCFFAGAAAWAATRRGLRASGYAVLALLLAEHLFLPDDGGGIRQLTAILTAGVLVLARPWDLRLAALPVLQPLYWVGGISYSLYLVHLPLITPFQNLLGRWVSTKSTWFLLIWGGEFVLAIVGAYWMNRWVDAPVNRWRRKVI